MAINLEQAIKEEFGKKEPEYAPVERTTLTVKEIAEYLGLSVDLIYKLVRQKQIPHIKIGARILFKLSSIEKWLSELEEESINAAQ